MEKISSLVSRLAIAVVLFLAGNSAALASHIMGSDISFHCIGGNQYQVVVTLYRDCSGISAPTSIPVDVTSTCGTQTITCTANPQTSGIEVSQLCPTALSTCQGGSLPGVQVYVYEGTVTVQPGCGLYTFSYDDCCRNQSNNIVSATSQGFMVRATLNSNLVTCENAPTFTSLPVPYFCVGQPVNYSHGSLDVDGDSLVYSLIPPIDDLGGNIPYNAPYTFTSPMPTNGGFGFDPQTGQMTFTASQVGVYVVDVLVSEYRNGQLIGSTMRDIQIVIINCSNNAPVVNNCLTNTNVSGGVVVDCNSLGVCPGQNVTFSIGVRDPDGQPVAVTSNIAVSIPGATLTTTQVGGPDSVLVTFNWMPLGTDTGFRYFTVQFEDNACPITGLQLFTYDITVLPGTTVGPDKYYCTGGGPVMVYATGGTHFSWTPTTGMISANADSSIVYFAPSATTTYYVQSDLQGGCKNRDTITVFNVPTYSTGTSSPDDTICLNASTTVLVTPTPSSQGPFTYLWGPVNTGIQNPVGQSTVVRPTTTTTYQVTVKSASGCTIHDSIQIVIQGIAPKIVVNPSDNYVCPGSPITLNSVVKSVECGPNSDPQNPCLPGSQFVLTDVGTGTGSASSNTTPYTGFWDDGRVQYLFRASELQAMGLAAGTITDIALNIAAKASTIPYNDLTIKMGCTTLSQLPSSFVSGLTQVSNPVAYTTVTGWNTHTLDIPFNWDGFSNIIVEICYDNSTWSGYDNVFYTTTSFPNSVLWDNGDLSTSSGCTGLTTPVLGQNRPNMRFIMCVAPLSNYTFTWTGSDGTSLPAVPDPTVNVNSNISYTVLIDDGTCQGDTTINLFVDSAVLVSAGNDTVICNSNAIQLNGEWLHPSAPVCSAAYTVSPIPYALLTAQGTVTNVTSFTGGLDDGITPAIPMPFPFDFFCQPVTNFYICTNGFVSFTGGSSTFVVSAIPNTNVPNNIIAFFWHDLNLNSGGYISYFVNGTAPNRVLVIRFNNVSFYGGTGLVDGQLQIYEDGDIEFHQTNFNTGNYTMGVEDATGTTGTTIPGANNQNVTFTGARAYRFSPITLGSQLQSILWTPSTGLSSDTILTPVASPTTTTDYVLTANFSNGCTTHDTVQITVGNFPYTLGVSPDTICPRDSAQLFFNGSGVSYSWTPSNVLTSGSAQNPVATPAVTTQFFVTAFDSIGCRVDDSITVIVKEHAPITLGQSDTICPNDSVILSPTGGPYLSYLWSNAATTSSISTANQTASSQDYWVRVNDGTCFFNSDTVNISEFVLTPIVVQPSGDTGVCIGDTIVLSADPGYVTYVWTNGSNSQQISVSVGGDYSYTATDQNGCVLSAQDTAHVMAVQHPLADIIATSDSICVGQTGVTLYVNPVSGIVYTWNPGNVVADSLLVTAPGTYSLTANDNGCITIKDIAIGSSNPPVLDLGADQNICGCDTAVTLASNVVGTYIWSTNDSTQSIEVTTSGIYALTVTDNNQCTASDDVSIDVRCLTVDAIVADPPTGTVFVGNNAGLDVTSTSYVSVFDYSWRPSSFLDDSTKKSPAVQNALTTTTYTVMVTDQEYGCVAYDTVTLAVIPPGLIPMPNAFSPNGDGVNDTYGPYIPTALQSFWTVVEMRIYNRWGQLVFNGNTDWDGYWSGVLQPADTYIYYITLNGPDQNNPQNYINYNLTGSFTLLH